LSPSHRFLNRLGVSAFLPSTVRRHCRATRRFKRISLSCAPGALLLACLLCGGQQRSEAAKPLAVPAFVPALSPYIDAHVHIDQHDPQGSIQSVLRAMKELNSAKMLILAEPYAPENPERWEAELILPIAKKYPDRIGVLGGGGSLNGMIQQSVHTGDAGPEIQRKFKEQAELLIREGVAGFGELTTEHLSVPSSPLPEYEYAPVDHPLLLLLADIAAQHNVPIDLHIEAIPKTMPRPEGLKPPNPPELPENIAPLERLLKHNLGARIIWAHAGSDNTGYRTPDLCRRLLRSNPNLYMEIKADPSSPGKNYPLADGKIKPDWLKLFEDFPDRFIIGSDQHYGPVLPASLPRAQTTVMLLNQLPPALREKIAIQNARRIYHGSSGS
jgi:predicted TIM-barrel fold metal-dependent hydrolase